MAQHIPVSLLELNTFGHAICALLIYLIWWEKPFEVDYPNVIESPYLWGIFALKNTNIYNTPLVKSVRSEFETFCKSHPKFSLFSKVVKFLSYLPLHLLRSLQYCIYEIKSNVAIVILSAQ